MTLRKAVFILVMVWGLLGCATSEREGLPLEEAFAAIRESLQVMELERALSTRGCAIDVPWQNMPSVRYGAAGSERVNVTGHFVCEDGGDGFFVALAGSEPSIEGIEVAALAMFGPVNGARRVLTFDAEGTLIELSLDEALHAEFHTLARDAWGDPLEGADAEVPPGGADGGGDGDWVARGASACAQVLGVPGVDHEGEYLACCDCQSQVVHCLEFIARVPPTDVEQCYWDYICTGGSIDERCQGREPLDSDQTLICERFVQAGLDSPEDQREFLAQAAAAERERQAHLATLTVVAHGGAALTGYFTGPFGGAGAKALGAFLLRHLVPEAMSNATLMVNMDDLFTRMDAWGPAGPQGYCAENRTEHYRCHTPHCVPNWDGSRLACGGFPTVYECRGPDDMYIRESDGRTRIGFSECAAGATRLQDRTGSGPVFATRSPDWPAGQRSGLSTSYAYDDRFFECCNEHTYVTYMYSKRDWITEPRGVVFSDTYGYMAQYPFVCAWFTPTLDAGTIAPVDGIPDTYIVGGNNQFGESCTWDAIVDPELSGGAIATTIAVSELARPVASCE